MGRRLKGLPRHVVSVPPLLSPFLIWITRAEANGNVKNWDDCSDTPFLVNQARRLVCTYDDPDSIYDKV